MSIATCWGCTPHRHANNHWNFLPYWFLVKIVNSFLWGHVFTQGLHIHLGLQHLKIGSSFNTFWTKISHLETHLIKMPRSKSHTEHRWKCSTAVKSQKRKASKIVIFKNWAYAIGPSVNTIWGLNWFFLPNPILYNLSNFQQQNPLKNQYPSYLSSENCEINSIKSDSPRASQECQERFRIPIQFSVSIFDVI